MNQKTQMKLKVQLFKNIQKKKKKLYQTKTKTK